MRIALYARVSTQRQAQADGIAQQLERLLAHAQAQGWAPSEETIFRDDGYSGASLKRPGLERLRDCAARRDLDRVLITAPDRLARNFVHQMVVLEELQRRGVVAEYERTLIADRMRRGRQARLRSGQLLPWTRAPYGYRLHPERPRDPAAVGLDTVAAAVVQDLFAADAPGGVTLHTLAGQLTARGVPTLDRQADLAADDDPWAAHQSGLQGPGGQRPAADRSGPTAEVGAGADRQGGRHHGAPTPGVDHRPRPRVGGG